jgi:fibronectin-binding autotransporter adhesin
MAFGLAPLSQSYKADMRMIGGIVTGSSGEFLALPISSTVLQGLSGLTTNEWSRFYLSDSFGAASASVIQALNYLSASMDATSGDVSGPASSTDNAVVRFDGTGGKTIQNSTLVTFTDAGAFTGGAGGASYTLAANGQISGTNAVVAGTTVSGAGDVSGKSLTTEESTISVAGVVSGAGAGTFGTLTTEEASISIAGVVSGAGALQGQSVSVANAVVITTAGAVEAATSVVATTTLSGAGAASAASLTTEEGSISVAGVVSGAGAGQFGTLATEEATISVAGVVSGAGTATFGGVSSRTALATTIVSGASLGIGSADDNGLTVTVAGLVAGGAGLDSYGITAAGLFSGSAVTAGTDISASGLVSANALTTEEAAISVAGVISGAGTITAGGISVGNGAGQITAGGGGVFGGTLQAAALNAGGITAAIDGFISGTVSAGIVATNTGSVNNANQKVAFAISSSDISTAANAALIPRMVMQGTNEAGALASYMVTITGGLLQTIELSYGTALPV